MDIPLSISDYDRRIAKEAPIRALNRYFEVNPVLNEGKSAMLARMGLRRFLHIGDGPIRGIYSQPGSFGDALFAVSGDVLYRVATDLSVTTIGTIEGAGTGAVTMAATSNIGETPAFLFIASGGPLMCFTENGFSHGTVSGTPDDGDVIQIGNVHYLFTSGSVDLGTPDGTSLNPWRVKFDLVPEAAWINFRAAIGANGTAGVQYSTALVAHPTVLVQTYTGGGTVIRAKVLGPAQDAIVTTSTGVAILWSAATLMGGGSPYLFQVNTPDDVNVISVGYVSSYVVVVPAQGQGINGRFYWIKPGETTIDPLDFATAERSPDPITSVVVAGDQFWLPGTNTTEVWFFTGNPSSPVSRMQGVVYDRGCWEGTALQVKDSMILVDPEGAVYQVSGGVTRISRPDIEERIRKAIQYQASKLIGGI